MKKIAAIISLLLPLTCCAKATITPAEKSLNSLINSSSKNVDFRFLVSAQKLLKEWKTDKRPLLIDVRSSKDFTRYSIPGSINIPLYLIKTKARLRNKNIVLLNEGHSYHRLAKELIKLKKMKFSSARVLRGGLVAWSKMGGTINGNLFAMKQMNKVSPREFFPDRDYEEIEIFQIHKRGNELGKKVLPQAMGLPEMTSAQGEKKLAQTLNALISRKKNKLLYVVIATTDDANQRLENALQKAIDEPIFFLQGGTKAYEAYLKGQVNLWLHAGKKRREGCATCQ